VVKIGSDRIVEIACEIIKPYLNDKYQPLPVLIDIMDKFNIEYNVYRYRSEKFSGMLFQEEGKYVIVANGRHHIKKRTFTAAHELGHFFLHLHLMDKFLCSELLKTRQKKIEREANRFAAEILMPADFFISKIKEYNRDFKGIADELVLSEETVRWRYVDLVAERTQIPRRLLINQFIKGVETIYV
jgi:Zn-dependent peptidase ImmA (M78 family)